jgi:hypothetical protein
MLRDPNELFRGDYVVDAELSGDGPDVDVDPVDSGNHLQGDQAGVHFI